MDVEDPVAVGHAESEWSHLPLRFVERVADATKVQISEEHVALINGMIRGLATARYERVKAHRSAADVFGGKADAIARVQQILKEGSWDATPIGGHVVHINAGYIACELAPLGELYRQAFQAQQERLSQLLRPGYFVRERDELWEALFVIWGSLLGQKIKPRKRGVVEFVQIASERVAFAAGKRRSQIQGFWDNDTDRRRRIKAKIEDEWSVMEYRIFSEWGPV